MWWVTGTGRPAASKTSENAEIPNASTPVLAVSGSADIIESVMKAPKSPAPRPSTVLMPNPSWERTQAPSSSGANLPKPLLPDLPGAMIGDFPNSTRTKIAEITTVSATESVFSPNHGIAAIAFWITYPSTPNRAPTPSTSARANPAIGATMSLPSRPL